jgi:hypothetical protein
MHSTNVAENGDMTPEWSLDPTSTLPCGIADKTSADTVNWYAVTKTSDTNNIVITSAKNIYSNPYAEATGYTLPGSVASGYVGQLLTPIIYTAPGNYQGENDQRMGATPYKVTAAFDAAGTGAQAALANSGTQYARLTLSDSGPDSRTATILTLAKITSAGSAGAVSAIGGTVAGASSPLVAGDELKYTVAAADAVNGVVSIKLTASVSPFLDVKDGDWFLGDVEYVYKNGLIKGTEPNLFSPDDNLTRAMLVTILYRQEGSPEVSGSAPFSDAVNGEYYADAVKWAAANGIAFGSDGKFNPNEPITRQDLATILSRYAAYAKISIQAMRNSSEFADASSISDYAKSAVESLYRAGVISGKENNLFGPSNSATRAETAAMIHRLLD